MQNDPLPSSKIFRMKPDLSFFPSLSDEGKFTQFYQGFEAAACSTGLGEVVDFSYRPPPGTNEEVSFRNKAMWLYYILYCKVTTTEGRDIIHRHRNTKNGRMVLYDLCRHARSSTSCLLRTQSIFGHLATTVLDSSWTKPYIDYITWFMRMAIQYNCYGEYFPIPINLVWD